jgi:gliding motility-associated-like protein
LQFGPVHKIFFPGLLLLAVCTGPAAGQITSAAANYRDSLSYPVDPGRDPLFVFYQPPGQERTGSLAATLPGSGSYDFEWSRYNPVLPGYDLPFRTEAGVTSSAVTGLEEGGYRVRIHNGTGTDTTLRAWVLINHLRATTDKTEEGHLADKWRDCDRLALNGFVDRDSLIYYDPSSHVKLSRILDFRFRWTSDNTDLKIPNDTIILAPNITYAPPYRDTWYILTVTDEMLMVDVDSVFYESIQTKAGFSVEYYDKVTGTFDPDLSGEFSKDRGSMDAKLTVRFINESLNGDHYLWVLLDTTGGIREEVTTYGLEEKPEFTYFNADKYYYPYMYSYSEEDCVDSSRMEGGIYVEPSQLDIPNVFTPNGDQSNDVWIFKHQSLKTCRVTIVDRTGKVVYRKEIDDIYEWEGWNGDMHESDRRAPEGQYYFVVEALGYDGVEYKDPSIWSQMKIFGGAGTGNKGGTGGTTTPGGGNGTEQQPGTLYTGWLYLFRH